MSRYGHKQRRDFGGLTRLFRMIAVIVPRGKQFGICYGELALENIEQVFKPVRLIKIGVVKPGNAKTDLR